LISVGLLLVRNAVTSAGVQNLAAEGGIVYPVLGQQALD
jgi:hypothetical protein